MKYAFGVLIIGIAAGLLWFADNFEVSPKVRKKIGPTVVESTEQMGVLMYRRLFQEMDQSNIVVLGFDSSIKDKQEIVTGFLKTAEHYKKNFHVIYKEGAGFNINGLDVKYFSQDNCNSVNKCLMLVGANNSSRFYPKSISEKNFLINELISISFVPVVEKKELSIDCKKESAIECVQQSFLTRYKKRKYKFDKDFIALEMHRDKDYYALVNQQ